MKNPRLIEDPELTQKVFGGISYDREGEFDNIRPARRSEPKGHHTCPCGSGKKYKKCCKPKGGYHAE